MKLEIVGKFYDNHSLAKVNRNLVLQFDKLDNLDFFITPTDSFSPDSKVDREEVKLLKKYDLKEPPFEPDIQLRHSYPPIWRWPLSEKTKIVYIQPWEWSKVPFEWQYKWETFADAIITPSQWTANIIAEGGIEPSKLVVVPNGYNPDIYNTDPQETTLFDSSKFTFTFVGCGQHRKGLDILLTAWRDAFVKADNVQLFIKDTPQIYGQSNIINEILALQYKSDCATIIYNEDNLSETEMAGIFKNSYGLVHPYRGEGFGMHVQEAFACGAIPVVTKHGPTDEFIPDNVAMKINAQKKFIDLTDRNLFATKDGDSLTLMNTHSWIIEPVVDHLKECLKILYFHHNKKELKQKIKEHQNHNTWKNIAKGYEGVLRDIARDKKKPKRFR